MEGGSCRAAAASAVLPVPDELIVEILARLPAKSLCLCKCVSRAWRAFISDPANRRRFAQTLSGLFFSRPYGSRPTWDFVGLSMSSVLPPPPGVDAALSFLPPTCGEMELLDSCNGLLLLRCEDSRERPSPPPFYVVCNPATGEWVALPQPSRVPGFVGYSTTVGRTMDTGSAALGFDPSISPHFYVFQLVQVLTHLDFFVRAVEIYSSQTGRWVLSEIELQGEMADESDYIHFTGQMTYFKGFLHLCMRFNAVVSVHTEGKTWKISQLRHRQHEGYCPVFSVCHSQGRLLFVDSNDRSSDVMSIYVLEDLDSEEWTWVFKQSIEKPDLFVPRMPQRIWDYDTAAFHPDSDLIFFYDWSQKRLVSYDMKHRDVHVICTLEVPYFEFRKFLPYVPLYSGALPSSCLN
ncbi:F-box protein At5g07610-like [Miscanthus floridulus]|uniref:F-box protein At5g07610-like n=1 Tax=Miscanthus floridulus TaxID=154761 RepID=UPI00345A8D6E